VSRRPGLTSGFGPVLVGVVSARDDVCDRLLDAVRVVAAGEALPAPSITRLLIEEFARAARPAPGALPEALAELTAPELEVLRLVAAGMSNAEIAAELVLGANTIKTHVARVLSKLGVRDRVQAVVLAYETGFVAPDLHPRATAGGGRGPARRLHRPMIWPSPSDAFGDRARARGNAHGSRPPGVLGDFRSRR